MTRLLKWKMAPVLGVVLLISAGSVWADGFNAFRRDGLSNNIYTFGQQNFGQDFSALRLASGSPQAPILVSDQAVSQSAGFLLGKTTLQLTYQNVGQDYDRGSVFRQGFSASDPQVQQLLKQRGMKRIGLALQLASGPQGATGAIPSGLHWNSVSDNSGSFWSRGLNFDSKNVGLSVDIHGADAGFARIKDLTDAEKTQMALQIKRQFDPSATAAQVTEADKTALLRQAGYERSNYALRFGAGATANWVQMFKIAGHGGGIERSSLRLAGKNYHLNVFKQSIDQGFTGITKLTTAEIAQFGRESGMDRTNVTGDTKIGKNLSGTMAFSNVSTKDAGLTRQSFGLTSKKFAFTANMLNIDPKFTRIIDLADTDKYTLLPEIGYRRRDMSFSYSGIKNLSFSSFAMNARNDTSKLNRDQFRVNMTYAPDSNTKFTLLNDSYNYTSDKSGDIGSYLHRTLALEHHFGKGLFLSGSRDTMDMQVKSASYPIALKQLLHLETDKSKNWFISTDKNSLAYQTGKFENTIDMNFRYAVSKTMLITARRLTIDRGADPSAASSILDLQYGLKNGMGLTLHTMQRTTTNNLDGTSRNIMLNLKPMKTIAWLTNAKVSAGFTTDEVQGQTATTNATTRLESGLFGGNMMIEYAGKRASDRASTTMTAYQFTSDRDPKKWLHFDALYKNRYDLLGKPYLVRAYNADAKLFKDTTINYSYYTYPEAAGLITKTAGSAYKLATSLGSDLKLVLNYSKTNNFLYKTHVVPVTIGITGKLHYGADFELSLGRSLSQTAYGMTDAKTMHVKYSHEISADHFLNLEADVNLWDSTTPSAVKLPNYTEARVDYAMRFGRAGK